MSEQQRPIEHLGWFGKIPSLGDFAGRGLPPSFVSAWDAWLSVELPAARSAWADAWVATYRAAPILCFSVSAGLLDEHAWHGLLLPSVDRVGREFPLTFAQSRAAQAAVPRQPSWWNALAAVGRRVLARECGADELSAALGSVPVCTPPAAPAGAERGSEWWPLEDAGPETRFDGLPHGECFRKLLGRP